ncbi:MULTISPECIES: DUF3108 domain-containing protein [Bosea]|jgi:hypothetical protein|uniref:DUF3108 domain-containing protein n=1 Tax=Bosea TaxID=85413 RepID=UPI00214FC57A|nr:MULTISPECIES: DUF3108 domain-containing protein [Bosea]MCR4524241.1 DUF3108 domain-containing protein [Bosea sp. 47.2.35]MDR6831183.1 hypothetical protein [Bosea robiniae]MDR6897923.1 hypothetical protein [Bosea sp. BE109]MDR7141318.1 hypothetical protein [Bosea sp. BE168]MDR7177980.1 hypothetical protein [Bosea sp. BE271]
MKSAVASSLAGFVLAAGLAAGANAASLDARYDVSLLGITLGTASLSGGIDNSGYKLDMSAKLTGIAGGVTGGRGSGAATGVLVGGRLAPKTFAVSSANSSESRTVRMALAEGSVAGIDIEPPIDEKPDRVPLNDSHKRNIVDPLSAFLMPVNGKGKDGACNRTLPIFDGAARYDIKLTSAGTRNVKLEGYSGPVSICQARYVPIAGHRALRPSTKFMAENRDITTWLAPIAGTDVMVPVRISVKTMIGTAVIEASSFKVDPGVTASARN